VQADAAEKRRIADEKARMERQDVKRMMEAPAIARDAAGRIELLEWMDAHCWACGAEGFTARMYIVEAFGIVLLCRECAGKTGRKDFDETFMPKVSHESVVSGMAIAAAAGSVIEGIAAEEIRRQAEQN
jgi:uncharacterized membrane protein